MFVNEKVAIVMGSDSDLPIVKKAAQVLKDFGVPTELRVLSAHRCAAEVSEFARNAEKNGTGVIIAAAGKAAHLAGAIAGQTPLPVIGIPIKASALEGIDALLSTVQMPAGVPVATVAIDGAANAAFLAVQILAVSDDALMEKMKAYRAAQTAKVLEADKKWSRYLPSFDRCTIYNVINKYGTAAEERINKMERKNSFTKERQRRYLQPMIPTLLSYPTRMMQQHSTASRKALSQVRALSTTK